MNGRKRLCNGIVISDFFSYDGHQYSAVVKDSSLFHCDEHDLMIALLMALRTFVKGSQLIIYPLCPRAAGATAMQC